jgi:hypothetical protein
MKEKRIFTAKTRRGQRTSRTRNDEADARAARKALKLMERKRLKPIPWRKVKMELGL